MVVVREQRLGRRAEGEAASGRVMARCAAPEAAMRDLMDHDDRRSDQWNRQLRSDKNLVSSLDNSPVHPPQLWSSVVAASALAFVSDHRNVVHSLPKSIRGSGCEMRNGVLVARSHFHGQEEEEGCQEGRQEEDDQEEGPWLSLPCRAAREGESGTDARAPGFHSWHPGGPVKRPDPSPWPPVCRVLSGTWI